MDTSDLISVKFEPNDDISPELQQTFDYDSAQDDNDTYTDTCKQNQVQILVKHERIEDEDCLDPQVTVKIEPVEYPKDSKRFIEESLYVDHEVHNDIVLGPTILSKPDIMCSNSDAIKTTFKGEQEQKSRKRTRTCVKTKQNIKSEPIQKWRGEKFSCEICFKVFSIKSNLSRHMNEYHSKKTLFSCDECHRTFKRKEGFLLHKAQHSKKQHEFNKRQKIENLKNVICECGKKMLINNLRRHKSGYCTARTGLNSGEHTCHVCKKVFPNKTRLNIHKYWHKRRKLICDVCNQSFWQKMDLSIHMRKHMDVAVRSYKCEICNRAYSRKHDLNLHLFKHCKTS